MYSQALLIEVNISMDLLACNLNVYIKSLKTVLTHYPLIGMQPERMVRDMWGHHLSGGKISLETQLSLISQSMEGLALED